MQIEKTLRIRPKLQKQLKSYKNDNLDSMNPRLLNNATLRMLRRVTYIFETYEPGKELEIRKKILERFPIVNENIETTKKQIKLSANKIICSGARSIALEIAKIFNPHIINKFAKEILIAEIKSILIILDDIIKVKTYENELSEEVKTETTKFISKINDLLKRYSGSKGLRYSKMKPAARATSSE